MSWQNVRGHDAVIEAFDRARRRGRLAHAYLFAGPHGIGKRRFAVELARALLCEAPPGTRLEACGTCASCALVEAGSHPDLFITGRPEDKLEFPIDVMKEFCRQFSLKSARGHGKVAVLDDADDLNDESANCFLKTLEEPPPGSLLILIGSGTERQLPTIVSRCQVVRFAPLPEDLVVELLRAQGIEDTKQLHRLARLGGCSPGQALELADPALWEFRRTLLKGLAAARVDGVALGRLWSEFVEEAGKEAALQRRRASLALRLLIEMLRDALTLKLGGTPHTAEPDDLPLLQELIQRASVERLLGLLERAHQADAQIDRRVQLVLILEALTDALGQLRAAS